MTPLQSSHVRKPKHFKKKLSNNAAASQSLKKETQSDENNQFPFELVTKNTRKQGEHAFRWLLHPLDVNDFLSNIFEKTPKIVHDHPEKFRSLIRLSQIQELVTLGKLEYGKDLDVTRYVAEYGRSTHNGPTGQIAGKEAWTAFQTGASLRLLRPQIYAEGIYRLCAHLEAFVDCVVGANVYITPKGCQGFAPHFDDVDAFVCQVSGSKRWRVYAPRDDGLDKLPRRSSVDFSRKDVEKTEVVIDTVLAPGDMLYLPRGAVHEARTIDDDGKNGADDTNEVGDGEHEVEGCSIHVTVSMFQKWTWADLLAESAVLAVHSAACEDVQLRRTLPLCFSRFAGAGFADSNHSKREWFHGKVQTMMRRVAEHFPTDTAADLLAAQFTRQRLPPPITESKQQKEGGAEAVVKAQSMVRAVCDGAARIIVDAEGDSIGLPRIVTSVRNRRDRGMVGEDDKIGSGDGQWTESSCLPEEGQAINFVLGKYPKAVRIRDIPFDKSLEETVELVQGLVEAGVFEVVR